MNRILFEPSEIESDGRVVLSDSRAEHIRGVLKAEPGKTLKTGVVNGKRGLSSVLEVSDSRVLLETFHTELSPEPWFDLILAAPRPLALKRLWPQLTSLGAGRIVLVKARRVEKCYFSSQWVQPESVRHLLIEGAMQAGTTHIPEFVVRMNFKRFMKEEISENFPDALALLAHPGPITPMEFFNYHARRPLIAIGAEGGWGDDEIALFEEYGFKLFSLGRRILRSDTACVALISVLNYALRCRG